MRVNKTLREQITGIRVVRAFVREPFETRRFETANRELTDVALRVGRWMALMFPLVFLILNVSSVAVLWFGAQRVDAGLMQVGSMTAFLAYLIQILIAVMMATFMPVLVPRATVSAGRIAEVLDTESSVVPPMAPVTQLRERSCASARRFGSRGWSTATPGRVSRCCGISPSGHSPGRPRPSSARPAPARARCWV